MVVVTVAVVTRKLVEQQLHRADVQVQLVHMVLTEVPDLQVPDEVKTAISQVKGRCFDLKRRDRAVDFPPVSLSDSTDWRQLAHQQFEDSGFTGTIFTDLPSNNSHTVQIVHY